MTQLPQRPRPAHVQLFIDQHLSDARAVAERWNIPVSSVLAASAVETEWGKHVRGGSWFGVTGTGGTAGSVRFGTHEFDSHGVKHAQTRTFRSYKTFRESAEDYGRLVTTNWHYRPALQYRDDGPRFSEATGRAYATNPRHAQALVSVIEDFNLTEFDQRPKPP